MEHQPKVSIVIPHYGDAEPTLALVEQLRPQRPHEVIIVDDCSPIPFPETTGVKVVHRGTNGGFGSAVNSGAAIATGEWLLILNSDLCVASDFLVELTAAALPWMPAVVGPAIVDGDGHPAHTARRFPSITQQSIEWLTPLARYRDTSWWHYGVGHDPLSTTPTVTDWLVGAALLIPLDEFRAVGGFDEGYYMNVEEVDLQRRLRARRLPSVQVPQVEIVHIGGGSSDPAKRRRWVAASRNRYATIWGGSTRLKLSLSAATGINLVTNGIRRATGRPLRPIDIAREELDLIWNT